MLLEPSKSQQNGLFHRIVWPGLMSHRGCAASQRVAGLYITILWLKAQSHAAMLHICDGVFKRPYDASE